MMLWHNLALLAVVLAGCVGSPDEFGRIEAPIIHGTPDTTHDAVGTVFAGTSLCTGTLIDADSVLTAAHCVLDSNNQPRPPASIEFGVMPNAVNVSRVPVASIAIHPQARNGGVLDYQHDLALLRLASPVSTAHPLPLIPLGTPAPSNETLVAVGVGIDEGGLLAGKRKATARVLGSYANFYTLTEGACVSSVTAPGDSGGPSLTSFAGVDFVLGVHTGTGVDAGCAAGFDVRVDAHRGWIAANAGLPESVEIYPAKPLSVVTIDAVSRLDMSVEADVTLDTNSTSPYAGVVARYSTSGSYYFALLTHRPNGATYAEIYRVVNHVFSPPLASVLVPFTPVARLRLDVFGDSLTLYLNGTPQTYATDSTLTLGLAGRFAASGSTVTNATVATLSPALTPWPYSNTFDALATNAPLDSSWSPRTGRFLGASGGVVAQTADGSLTTVNATARANVSVESNVSLAPGGGTAWVGVVARHSSPGNYYTGMLVRSSGVVYAQIYRVANHVFAPVLASTVIPSQASDRVRFDVNGEALTLYVNGALRAYANDAVLTTGQVGMIASQSGRLDDFSASSVNAISPAWPYSDAFAAVPPNSPLDLAWSPRTGMFLESSGAIVAQPVEGSLATLNGLDRANVSLEADVSLAPGGGTAWVGVVARHSSPGNYYTGMLVRSGGVVYAQIYRVANNVFGPALGSAVVTSAPGDRIRFDVNGDALAFYVNGTLRTYANDSALATGKVGILASQNGAFEHFFASVVSPISPELPYSDAFDALAANAPLDLAWSHRSGMFLATSGAVAGQGADSNVATLNGTDRADVSVESDVSLAPGAGTAWAGVVARHSSPGNYYTGMLVRSGGVVYAQIYRVVNGVFGAALGSSVITAAPGDRIRLDVVGDALTLYVNGTLRAYGTDSALASGKIGIVANPNSALDDFAATTLTALAPSLPYSTTFDGSNAPLDLAWSGRYGMFVTSSGDAVAQPPEGSLATLHGADQANVSVEAVVTLAPGGGTAWVGVLARYSSPGNYYTGMLVRSGGVVYAQIYRVVNNVFGSALGSAVITAAPGDRIRFEVIGDALAFYVNGTLRAYANDSALTTGKVGILANQNGRFGELSATSLTPLTPALPFTSSFDALAANAPLDLAWSHRSGMFLAASGAMVAQMTDSNVATLNGTDRANVSVEASVSLAPGGGTAWAGVVARHSGPGTYYTGMLVRSGGVVYAQIYRVVNGVFGAALGSSVIPSAASDRVRLEVNGAALSLYVNGTLRASANDTALTTGKVGVVANQNSAFDDFSASSP